jgi:hypothetical protein
MHTGGNASAPIPPSDGSGYSFFLSAIIKVED